MNFRWGIVGAGDVSRKFVSDLRNAEKSVATLVASRKPESAIQFASLFPGMRAVTSAEELIRSNEVDAVYIAMPPSEHRRLGLAAASAGKPMLIEKPFAANREDANAIVEAARHAGVFCMEGMWTRFLPAAFAIKRAIANGEIGEIRSVETNFGTSDVPDLEDNNFRPELGGGALMHRGVYGLAYGVWLLGSPLGVTSSAVFGKTGVDEDVVMTVRHERGLSTTHASLRSPLTNRVSIAGTEGRIDILGPVYRPYGYSLRRVRPRARGAPAGRWAGFQESNLVQGLSQRFASLIERSRDKPVARSANYSGNGYHYEADEVRRCVLSQATESKIMPLAETLVIMGLLGQLREDLNG